MTSSDELISVLMIGTGEYTTGYVHGQASDSDKVLHLIILYFDDVVALLVIIIYIYIIIKCGGSWSCCPHSIRSA